MTIKHVHGPIISTTDIDAHLRLFAGVFGLAPVCEQQLDPDAVHRTWGLSGISARTIVLETPGTQSGIRLVEFDPPSAVEIRSRASALDTDALKVIDFFAPDLEAALDQLRDAGFEPTGEPAEYDLPAGRLYESHVWGSDGVVCAVLSGPLSYFSGFVRVTDQRFSEVLSISGPVTDAAPALDFYRQVLGLDVVSQYELNDDSFRQLVGATQEIRLRGFNVGTSCDEPYFGIIDYGLPAGSTRSLRERSIMPHRGLVGATLYTDDIEGVCARCMAGRHTVIAPVATVDLAPHGRAQSLTIRAPHGIVHHLIQLN